MTPDEEFKQDNAGFGILALTEPWRYPRRQVIHVSRALLEGLETFNTPDISRHDRSIIDHCFALPIHVSDLLPRRNQTGRITQLDRFATYDAEDMAWAVPAGLAAWEVEEIHAFVVTLPDESPYMLSMAGV